jgi:quercetin dioxygenase-like cupin family protein
MSEQWPKIWGKNTELFQNESTSVNVLNLVKGGTCSRHHHRFKANIFYVISGKLKIHTDMGEEILHPGQSYNVAPLIKHQFEAMEVTVAIEVMYVKYSANDIVRECEGFIQPYGKKDGQEDG